MSFVFSFFSFVLALPHFSLHPLLRCVFSPSLSFPCLCAYRRFLSLAFCLFLPALFSLSLFGLVYQLQPLLHEYLLRRAPWPFPPTFPPQVKVYGYNINFDVAVKALQCGHCRHALPYEPAKHCFFPVRPTYWMTYQFFIEHELCVTRSITTLRATYDAAEARYRYSGGRLGGEKGLTWDAFLAAYWLWVDYDGDDHDAAFECPECAKLPWSERVVTIDGTTAAACKKRKLTSFPQDQHGPLPRDESAGTATPDM